MKISKIVLASMISATLMVNCVNKKTPKKVVKTKTDSTKTDSLTTKSDSIVHQNLNNCPACGMG